MVACESGELLCLASEWWNFVVTQVAFALAMIWAVISRYVPFASTVVDRAAAGVNYLFSWLGERERLQAFGTLAGVSFGIYKWWYNRESMLMRRMLDVLSNRDRRLDHIRLDAASAIATPGPNVKHTVPLFVVGKLQKVLRRRRWLPLLRTQKLPTATDRALQAATRLNKLIGAAEKIAASRRSELFSAHMLQGALASARSERYPKAEQQAAQNNIARRHFEDALATPGFATDRLARECLGAQLMKLKEYDKADEVFESLENEGMAAVNEDAVAVQAGRAAYFRGLIAAKADAREPSVIANQHLIRAVDHFGPKSPFLDVREQLQLARTHELHACVRRHLNFGLVERISLDAAQQSYAALRDNPALSGRFSDYIFWFWPSVRERRQGNREILQEVDAALKRIEERQNGQRVCVCGKDQPE